LTLHAKAMILTALHFREGLERFAKPIMNRQKPFIKEDPKPEPEVAAAAEGAEPMDAEGGEPAVAEGVPAADDLD